MSSITLSGMATKVDYNEGLFGNATLKKMKKNGRKNQRINDKEW